MTTNDHEAILTADVLDPCHRGDVVTIPSGWALPSGYQADSLIAPQTLEAGCYFENDGSHGSLSWQLFDNDGDSADWATSLDIERLQLPTSALDRADDDQESQGGEHIGHVHVRVIPDTDGFVEAVAKAAGEAADAIDAAGFHLDEYQRERVAALEQALRVLESRRDPKAGNEGALAGLFSKGTTVPAVAPRDLIDVAAFIAEADTGRTGVSA